MFDTAMPATALDAGDFNFDWHAGYEVSGILDRGCGTGIELRWMSVDPWDASTSVVTGMPALVQINNAIPFFLPGVTQIDANYSSGLHSLELNYRKCWNDCTTVFAGFRYLELDEHFHADVNAAVLATTYDVNTQNRLYGVQVGVQSALFSHVCWSFDGTAKAGLFANSSSQYSRLDTGIVSLDASGRSDRGAFVAELGVTGRRAINCNLDLMVGYNALFVETVTLATDQFNSTNFITGTGIDHNGGVFYHGAFVGFELRR